MATKAITKDQLIEAIESMTVLELSELVSTLEDKFGVSAAAPVAAAAGPAAEPTSAPKRAGFGSGCRQSYTSRPVLGTSWTHHQHLSHPIISTQFQQRLSQD